MQTASARSNLRSTKTLLGAPTAELANRAIRVARVSDAIYTSTAMPLTGYTILAVDDNESHNYAIKRTLENFGSSVLPARSGTQALELARKKPTLILMDVNLPDLNGFEVCRRLKADPITAAIPVVFMSATYHHPAAAAMAESVGAKAFLFYPVEKDQLLAVIRGQIARSAS